MATASVMLVQVIAPMVIILYQPGAGQGAARAACPPACARVHAPYGGQQSAPQAAASG